MPVNHIEVARPRDAVYAVLADPFCFERWVVGASEIRGAEGLWPAPGSLFHHTQGVSRVGVKDITRVVEATPPARLLLEVCARPFVVARVELVLHQVGERTHVQMAERPVGGLVARVDGRIVDRLLFLRNAESLRRFKRLCEETPPPGRTPDAVPSPPSRVAAGSAA